MGALSRETFGAATTADPSQTVGVGVVVLVGVEVQVGVKSLAPSPLTKDGLTELDLDVSVIVGVSVGESVTEGVSVGVSVVVIEGE